MSAACVLPPFPRPPVPGAPPPVLFGKLPDRADFVRQGESPALDALDTVAQRALWPPPPTADGPLYRFVYNPPGGPHLLVGALQLSHDRVGREYPLIVARPVDRRSLDPGAAPSWPLRWEATCDEAAVSVYGAVVGLAPAADVLARAAALPEATWDSDRSPPVDRHVRAAAALAAGDFARRLPGGAPQAARTLSSLAALLRQSALPGYGLRLPLPAPADDFGRADGVSFWLAAGAHLMRARPPWPSLFWTDASPGQPAALFVFYGSLSSKALRSLLLGAVDSDTVASLDVPAPGAAAAGTPAFDRLLADPHASVADVLARLHTLA